jgi:ribonuclease J
MSINLKPLGGTAEIGSNMFTIDDGRNGFIIDCGILFPYDNFYDINYLIPDFDSLDKDLFKDIIFTHGHEDHIGAVKHIQAFNNDIIVHASSFTNKLIQRKLQETKSIKPFTENIKIGNFTITPIHVNHSIPETSGLLIKHTEYDASFLYISDFKVEPDCQHEEYIELQKIKELQTNKLNFAFIDSTNIYVDKKGCSEKDVADELENLIKKAKGRVLITLFSSNVHRIKSIYEICLKLKKPLCTSGRSVEQYIKAATEVGIITESKKIHDESEIEASSDNSVVLISGCQGDFFGSLRRYASKEHSKLKPRPSDTVIFSSKAIPGNEKSVYRIMNQLTDLGVEIITTKNFKNVHSSGHASKEELTTLINNTNISHYIPIHGESCFLNEHFNFIKENFKNITPFQIRNFNTIELKENLSYKIHKEEALTPKIILRSGVVSPRQIISERRKAATRGLIFISCVLKSKSVKIDTTGFLLSDDELNHLISIVKMGLSQLKNKDKDSEKIRLLSLKYVKSILNSGPVIKVHIL